MFESTQAPIFIHSLFRSGSTWLFEKFRTSPAGYWCYQEPYHEALLQLNTNPESLLSYSEETAQSLRHPSMTAPYFREFYDIKEKLTGKFDKRISYDSFFDPQTCPAIFPYTETLITEAKGNPVLQCCRSFGRVPPLKEQFGGTHILLWRDPVNQWLSYQINDYFDSTSLAIINAQNPPVVIQRLRQEIGFNEVHAENVQSEFAAFSEAPLDAGQKYLIFYGLWLYHLLENQPLCEAEINLDMLSHSEEYVAGKTTELNTLNIPDIDLTQCNAPNSPITEAEKAYFEAIERHVENIFREVGCAPDRIEQALQLRRECRPQTKYNKNTLISSAGRARSIAFRYANHLAAAHRQIHQQRAQIQQLSAEINAAREAEKQSQLQASEALAQLEQTKADAIRTSLLAYEALAEAHQAKAEAFKAQASMLRECLDAEQGTDSADSPGSDA